MVLSSSEIDTLNMLIFGFLDPVRIDYCRLGLIVASL